MDGQKPEEGRERNDRPGGDAGRRGVLQTLVFLVVLGACGWLVFGSRQDSPAPLMKSPGSGAGEVAPTPAPGYEEIAVFPSGLREARAAALLADGQVVAAGDNKLRFFRSDGSLRRERELNAEPLALATTGTDLAVAFSQAVLFAPAEEFAGQDEVFKTGVRVVLPEGAKPVSLALSAELLLVADLNGPQVLLFTRGGKFLRSLAGEQPGREALRVPSPHLDAAFAAGGPILIANPGLHRVEIYDAGDHLLRTWGEYGNRSADFTGCCNPTNLAVLPDGNVVTAEKGIPRIKVYSPGGELLTLVAGPAGFDARTPGFDLSVNPSGTICALNPYDGVVHLYRKKEAGHDRN